MKKRIFIIYKAIILLMYNSIFKLYLSLVTKIHANRKFREKKF